MSFYILSTVNKESINNAFQKKKHLQKPRGVWKRAE